MAYAVSYMLSLFFSDRIIIIDSALYLEMIWNYIAEN